MTETLPRRPGVLFEDDTILVLNKPPGLAAHPAPSYKGETLVDWTRQRLGPKVLATFPDPNRLGLVHRLDKDTTGVIVVAKTPQAQTAMAYQFQERTVRKTYLAIVQGVPPAKEGIITAPVGRSHKDPTRMAVTTSGRASETAFTVTKSFKEAALMQVFPKTGRTHQIRVHCAAIGHPIVGDLTYGASKRWQNEFQVERPMLHAERLELQHPKTLKRMVFSAPLPADFKAVLKTLKKAFVIMGVTLLSSSMLQAEATSVKKKTMAAQKNPASSGESSGASTRQLKHDMAELKSDMEGVNTQLAQLAAALEQLNLANRLRDLERSVADLNTKASAALNTAEEGKTGSMEAQRRLKSFNENLETVRDQLDRLQRDMISLRTQKEAAASADPAPVK